MGTYLGADFPRHVSPLGWGQGWGLLNWVGERGAAKGLGAKGKTTAPLSGVPAPELSPLETRAHTLANMPPRAVLKT